MANTSNDVDAMRIGAFSLVHAADLDVLINLRTGTGFDLRSDEVDTSEPAAELSEDVTYVDEYE